MAASLDYKVHHYASERDLQQVGVWPVDLHDKSKYWIIYIHGGAWRDPSILHKTFTPAIDKILQDHQQISNSSIAAFASIDYRLTARPEAPQDANTTPTSQLRDAQHPDHVDDVAAAIRFLQHEYGFASNYVLLGHSAGATLAFQAAMTAADTSDTTNDDSNSNDRKEKIVLPKAIVGLCGIYDLNGLWHRTGGSYTFIRDVFGAEDNDNDNNDGRRASWDAASPARCPGDYSRILSPLPKVVLLASSPADELIDEAEIDIMAGRLRRDGVDAGIVTLVKDMRGKHDEIWSDGDELARMAMLALKHVVGEK